MRLPIHATISRQNHFVHRVARTLYVREFTQETPVGNRTYNVRATQRLGVRIRHRTYTIGRLAVGKPLKASFTHKRFLQLSLIVATLRGCVQDPVLHTKYGKERVFGRPGLSFFVVRSSLGAWCPPPPMLRHAPFFHPLPFP